MWSESGWGYGGRGTREQAGASGPFVHFGAIGSSCSWGHAWPSRALTWGLSSLLSSGFEAFKMNNFLLLFLVFWSLSFLDGWDFMQRERTVSDISRLIIRRSLLFPFSVETRPTTLNFHFWNRTLFFLQIFISYVSRKFCLDVVWVVLCHADIFTDTNFGKIGLRLYGIINHVYAKKTCLKGLYIHIYTV